MDPFSAIAIARALWAWRFTVLLGVVIAGGGWALWHMNNLEREAKDARVAVGEAVRINGDLAKSNERLQAAKEHAEKSLAGRLARKTEEAERLSTLVERITAQEKTNACALSPAIRTLLDGLRSDGVVE